MEIGRGFLVVILDIKMEIMALKEFHPHPMCLEQDITPLIGSITMETFGYLADRDEPPVAAVDIHNIHIC
jgi:hypothetical protein